MPVRIVKIQTENVSRIYYNDGSAIHCLLKLDCWRVGRLATAMAMMSVGVGVRWPMCCGVYLHAAAEEKGKKKREAWSGSMKRLDGEWGRGAVPALVPHLATSLAHARGHAARCPLRRVTLKIRLLLVYPFFLLDWSELRRPLLSVRFFWRFCKI